MRPVLSTVSLISALSGFAAAVSIAASCCRLASRRNLSLAFCLRDSSALLPRTTISRCVPTDRIFVRVSFLRSGFSVTAFFNNLNQCFQSPVCVGLIFRKPREPHLVVFLKLDEVVYPSVLVGKLLLITYLVVNQVVYLAILFSRFAALTQPALTKSLAIRSNLSSLASVVISLGVSVRSVIGFVLVDQDNRFLGNLLFSILTFRRLRAV